MRLSLLFLLILTVHAHAAGRWNMPTTPAQCFGWGFGPGYHAPMTLGSACLAPVEYPGVQRSLRPLPSPQYVYVPELHRPPPAVPAEGLQHMPYTKPFAPPAPVFGPPRGVETGPALQGAERLPPPSHEPASPSDARRIIQPTPRW